MRGWQPAVDLCEDDDTFTLKAEIPGVEQKMWTLTVTPENITLRGTVDREEEEQEKDIFVQSDVMVNLRTVALPAEIKPGTARATFRTGS